MTDLIFLNVHRSLGNTRHNWQSCLGLMSMAAFLEKNGYDAKVANCNYYEIMNDMESNSDRYKSSLLGLYCDFDNVYEVQNISSWVKSNWKIPVIVGGPQSKHLDKSFLEKSRCDAVVRGEGELTIIELVNLYLEGTGNLKDIKGIAYLDGDMLKVNEDQVLIENLDMLPFCDEKYILKNREDSNFWVCMTGRGCPFSCSFCFEALSSKKVRFRTVENVLAELESKMAGNSPYRYLMFADDTFTLIPERVKALCAGIKKIRESNDFVWFCEGHVRTLLKNPEMIDDMVQSGMVRLQLGIESGNKEVLEAYNKGCTPEDIIQLVKLCKEKGVKSVYGNIILGSAFFSEDTFKCDLEFAKTLIEISEGIVELAVVYYWPLAGTKMTNNPQNYGILLEDTEFVTGMMDIPQTSTERYSLWDIHRFGYEFNEELRKHIISMLKDGRISRNRIMEWYGSKKNYGAGNSLWLNIVKAFPEVNQYFQLLLKDEIIREEEITDAEFYSLHPLRLVNLYQQFDGHKINNILFDDIEIDKIDMEIIRYSYGKLNVEQVIDSVIRVFEYMSIPKDQFKDLLVTKFRRLENSYLIAFGKF